MKVGVVTSDVKPCELFRARGPAEALARKGEIELVMLRSTDMMVENDYYFDSVLKPLRVRYANRRFGPAEPVGLIEAPDVDVVVMTRGVFPERIHGIMRLLQREGIAVVVDYDDAYDRLPAALHTRYKINPTLNPGYNWVNAIDAAKIADVTTVSTPALRRYNHDAIVLKNCVPIRHLRVGERTLGKRTGDLVGWGGTVFGHPYDLRIPGGGVVEAMRRTGARFLNVGDGVNIKEELGLDEDIEVSGIVMPDEYVERMAMVDVAIAPLHDSSYTHAKSHLKMLEGLALGSQVVASPTREYRALRSELELWCTQHDRPIPATIASKPRHWRNAIVRALEVAGDEEYARAGMDFVNEHYCLAGQASRCYDWAEAWELAIKKRHGSPVLRSMQTAD